MRTIGVFALTIAQVQTHRGILHINGDLYLQNWSAAERQAHNTTRHSVYKPEQVAHLVVDAQRSKGACPNVHSLLEGVVGVQLLQDAPVQGSELMSGSITSRLHIRPEVVLKIDTNTQCAL